MAGGLSFFVVSRRTDDRMVATILKSPMQTLVVVRSSTHNEVVFIISMPDFSAKTDRGEEVFFLGFQWLPRF